MTVFPKALGSPNYDWTTHAGPSIAQLTTFFSETNPQSSVTIMNARKPNTNNESRTKEVRVAGDVHVQVQAVHFGVIV